MTTHGVSPRRAHRLWMVLLVVAVGCGRQGPFMDGALQGEDAAGADGDVASTADAGDSGRADPDAGHVRFDAGHLDAGVPDDGGPTRPDAGGALDGGHAAVDGGRVRFDSGVAPDGGHMVGDASISEDDAGTGLDGGSVRIDGSSTPPDAAPPPPDAGPAMEGDASTADAGPVNACGVCDRYWRCSAATDYWRSSMGTCVNSRTHTRLSCDRTFEQRGGSVTVHGTWTVNASRTQMTLNYPSFSGTRRVYCYPADPP